jgi:hypothetical protein
MKLAQAGFGVNGVGPREYGTRALVTAIERCVLKLYVWFTPSKDFRTVNSYSWLLAT